MDMKMCELRGRCKQDHVDLESNFSSKFLGNQLYVFYCSISWMIVNANVVKFRTNSSVISFPLAAQADSPQCVHHSAKKERCSQAVAETPVTFKVIHDLF